ncbi:50S ribosomal protein L18 [endosymbiont of Pachyrhynchus infernalis]|uniref:50S ribosomal protein L18 n=1 Tax=endosymbiont of Pachyrhynchus infernalis TaxID=1971488 RepID=UPI000DC6E768|nr:50S ribosomal protein L18 [endosymbiont of Pachyrhynchus infernalis]BBA84848.1 50S ribosomal protein L18 [endosymbiont of Pachyrhynchus infernalis]
MKNKINKSYNLKIKNIRKKINNIKLNRLLIYKTSRHIYAQIFSIEKNNIEVYASTTEKSINKYLKNKNIYTGNKESACFIGKIISERSIKNNIFKVFLDKSGFRFHGKIKCLVESARKNGLII